MAGPGDLPLFRRMIEAALAPLGVNVLVLEVNDRYPFRSHPELSDGGALTKKGAPAASSTTRPHLLPRRGPPSCPGEDYP